MITFTTKTSQCSPSPWLHDVTALHVFLRHGIYKKVQFKIRKPLNIFSTPPVLVIKHHQALETCNSAATFIQKHSKSLTASFLTSRSQQQHQQHQPRRKLSFACCFELDFLYMFCIFLAAIDLLLFEFR